MIYEYQQEKRAELLPFFEGHKYMNRLILGIVQSDFGKIFVDDLKNPKNVMLHYGQLIAFGGPCEGKTADEFIPYIPKNIGFAFSNKKWRTLITAYFGVKLTRRTRTKLSSKTLDINHIKKLKENIPKGYKIIPLDNAILSRLENYPKTKFIRFCGSVERFSKMGFGFVALNEEGKIVADATNGGVVFQKAFELDVETHPDHRRKGLATAVCSHLLEYSLENGYDPHWDAANRFSVDLALKLGYSNPEEYELLLYFDD